jgi:5-methylcytosine-specific restriction endonuclease McrA
MCAVEKPLGDFTLSRSTLDGRGSYCRPCHYARTRAWRATPTGRARFIEYSRRYNAKHRVEPTARAFSCERCGATSLAGPQHPHKRFCSRFCQRNRVDRRRDPLSTRNRQSVYRKYGYVCYLCETAIDPTRKWPDPLAPTVDHVVPVASGGTSRIANLRPAHWDCNREKGDSLPHWWQLAAAA